MTDQFQNSKTKILILSLTILFTISFHYGWILQSLLSQYHWAHALHGRLCYIPIVMATVWFGLRGGLIIATVISLLVLPYIFNNDMGAHDLAGEIIEIIFYYAIAILTGALVERELKIRKKHAQANLQLERTHHLSMVGQIAAGVAHEIKNPLASIKGSVEILTDDTTNDLDKEEFKQIVFSEIKRIDTTVTNFLELSRPKEYTFQKLDLSSLIKTSLKQMNTHAIKFNISIQEQVKEGISIHGDNEKIQQVLLNLLLNAMQASPEGSTIKVNLDKINSQAQLQITDTGEGIPKEVLAKIYDPFFTTKSSGSGLGLSLVKNIVEKHNASIHFQTEEHKGTTVTVLFPLYGDSQL